MTQEELVERTGVSRSTVNRWERGDAERPDPDQVRVVCKALKVDPVEATIALGYLSREDVAGRRVLDPGIEEVVALLEDPALSTEEKRRWIDYLKYLGQRAAN